MAEFDELEWIRDQLQIDVDDWSEVMDTMVQRCDKCRSVAPSRSITVIQTYAQQLKAMAEAEKVDLLDACLHAGVPRSTYYRTFSQGKSITQSTAEQIAKAIQELGIR
jgi:hypothetical protein